MLLREMQMSRPRDRRKRPQVVRACDFCRRQRIKCDNRIPCSACQVRSSQCSNAELNYTTLPEACREIERLRRRLHELESQLGRDEGNRPRQASPRVSLPVATTGETATLMWSQEGVNVRAGQSPGPTWYGKSSLFFFISGVLRHLGLPDSGPSPREGIALPGSKLTRSLLDEPSREAAADTSMHELSSSPRVSQVQNHLALNLALTGDGQTNDGLSRAYNSSAVTVGNDWMTPTEEQYFIEFYWLSYHAALFPILNETEFQAHYRSLWLDHGDTRKASPLVDIVIALSMQIGIFARATRACGPRPNSISAGKLDGDVIGRRYFLRCQEFLAYEMESPTTSTLQSQLLCSVYLCNANFSNMSDAGCGTLIKLTYMLGLHVDPPDSLHPSEREARRRIWWAVYNLDTKVGIKYGRPFLVHQPVGCLPNLPEHTLDVVNDVGMRFGHLGCNLTWLSFHYYQSKLMVASREAHSAFFNNEKDALEESFHCLKDWTSSIPTPLQNQRDLEGTALSADLTPLIIDDFAPLWLQRQRLILELTYHNICISLRRPIIFDRSSPASPSAHRIAEECISHAMMLTSILHQVITTTTILDGWAEVFQWQWNAAMTLLGSSLVLPHIAPIATVKKSMDAGLHVLDAFGKAFAVATMAAEVIRRLRREIELAPGVGDCTANNQVSEYPTLSSAATATNVSIHGQDNSVNESLDGQRNRQEGEHEMSLHATSDAGNTLVAEADSLCDSSYLSDPSIFAAQSPVLHDLLNMAFDVDQWALSQMLWSSPGGLDFAGGRKGT